jgi:hypothetical protein
MSPLLLWFPPALRRCRGCLIIAEAGAKGVQFVTTICDGLLLGTRGSVMPGSLELHLSTSTFRFHPNQDAARS